MSTAEVAADLATAQAALAKTTDQLVKLAGDVAAATNAAAGLVTTLEAVDADLAVTTTATLAAKAAVDKAIIDLVGAPPPPPPPPSPTDTALILERSNVTGPEELPLGALEEAVTITAVVKVPPVDGKYRKLVGADGSDGKYGGLCVGITDKAQLEAWVDDGAGIRQAILPARVNKRSFVSYRILHGTTGARIDANAVAVSLPNGRVACDGKCAIGKGVWDHEWVNDMTGAEMPRLRIYRTERTDAEIDADKAEWASLIDPDDVVTPPGPPPSDGLEPVDGGAKAITVTTMGTRQKIVAWGAGAGPINELDRVFPRMKQYAKTDFDDIHLNLLRLIWSGNGDGLGRAYKPLIDWATDRVKSYGEKLWVHATGYGYSEGDPVGSAKRLAASIKAGTDAGCRLDSVCMQNEPGGTDPHWPDGDHAPAHKEMRAQLDAYGLQRITLTGLEYAKDDGWIAPGNVPKNVRRHFDQLDAAGLVPSAVAIGAVHCYGDCTSSHLYDERWLKRSCSIMQLECGFGSNPSVACRIINDLNTGVSHWSYHLLQAYSPDAPGDYGQKLVDFNGRPNGYYHPYRLLSTRFSTGTQAHLCVANGVRPFFTQGSKSSAFVAAGKRADGKWVVAGQSNGGGKQQLTFQLPEPIKGAMIGERCNSAGASSGYSVGAVDGYVRLTVGNNELAVLVGPS